MKSKGVEVAVGERILLPSGPAVVTALQRHGVTVRTSHGTDSIGYGQLVARAIGPDGLQAVHQSVDTWWAGLSAAARAEALNKLECVNELLTGYRQGLPELAQRGEPFYPFGPDYGVSLTARIEAMARQLSFERSLDRVLVRRVHAGEIVSEAVSPGAVRIWVKGWEERGLRGLVDGRRARGIKGFHDLDPRLLRVADEVLSAFDGDLSVTGQVEVERRIRKQLKLQGITDVEVPQRLFQEFLSVRLSQLGRTTRSHKARKLRETAGRSSHGLTGPGHVAIDVTRADNFVFDEASGKAVSVEIITAIDVVTRVVLACRVVARSALSLEAGLALYDAMRPFSMVVSGTDIDDFRWCGIPDSLDFGDTPLTATRRIRVRTDRDLQGRHIKPAVAPTSVRCDNGSIFVSEYFLSLLKSFGIDLKPSRAGRPIDNSFVERWHETIASALQQIPGNKGRNVQERGRMVNRGGEPLLTARELEIHLHRFIALQYHRSPHRGLRLPGMEDVALTPLERFDILSDITGRILVPQHPDLIYQFLPIRWLTVGHSGVEYRGLTYDGDILDDLRGLRPGTFRARDARVPFLYDPRDRTRLWHRDRDTDRIHELVWRDAHLVHAPLTDVVVDQARLTVKQRGVQHLSKRKVMLQIVEELTELTTAPSTDEWRNKLIASQLRHEQAISDHREVLQARVLQDSGQASGVTRIPNPSHTDQPVQERFTDAPWPDYDAMA